MKRLGINAGKYSGEGIDIRQVISEIERAAGEHGWVSDAFLEADSCRLLAFTRKMPDSRQTRLHLRRHPWR